MKNSSLTGALWFCVLLVVNGCTKPNPARCCTSPADCEAVRIQDTQRACEQPFVCIDHACESPAPTMCSIDADCPTSSPHCATDGTCVECVTSDQCPLEKPVCSAGSHACAACTADGDCASNVCDADTGMCVQENDVLYASPSGGDGAPCTKTAPCSITHAFATADGTRSTISLANGTYDAAVTVSGKSVVVHGYGATLNATAGQSAVVVHDGAHVRLLGLHVAEFNGLIAVWCKTTSASAPTPMLDVVDSFIETDNTPVFGYPCNISVSRSHLHAGNTGNAFFLGGNGTVDSARIDRSLLEGGDGIQALSDGATMRITNSVIANENGPDGAFGQPGNANIGFPHIYVSFSTIVNSLAKCGTSVPICGGGNTGGVCIDNSIIVNMSAGAPADTVTGAGCFSTYSIVYPQSTQISGSNNKLGVNPLLKDPANADYHLQPTSPAVDAADPSATDAQDYDGTPRPQGSHSDIGAFELKQ